jgi:hypothetical protein
MDNIIGVLLRSQLYTRAEGKEQEKNNVVNFHIIIDPVKVGLILLPAKHKKQFFIHQNRQRPSYCNLIFQLCNKD